MFKLRLQKPPLAYLWTNMLVLVFLLKALNLFEIQKSINIHAVTKQSKPSITRDLNKSAYTMVGVLHTNDLKITFWRRKYWFKPKGYLKCLILHLVESDLCLWNHFKSVLFLIKFHIRKSKKNIQTVILLEIYLNHISLCLYKKVFYIK